MRSCGFLSGDFYFVVMLRLPRVHRFFLRWGFREIMVVFFRRCDTVLDNDNVCVCAWASGQFLEKTKPWRHTYLTLVAGCEVCEGYACV